MILGLSIPAFTLGHVVISLLGIAFGGVVLAQMIAYRPLGLCNSLLPFWDISPPGISCRAARRPRRDN